MRSNDRTFAGVLTGLAGLGLLIINTADPGTGPFSIGVLLLVIVTALGLAHFIAGWRDRRDIPRAPYSPPPASPGPLQPQPAPLPEPDLVQTRSGHKPVNRELPADRPHTWRTWEG